MRTYVIIGCALAAVAILVAIIMSDDAARDVPKNSIAGRMEWRRLMSDGLAQRFGNGRGHDALTLEGSDEDVIVVEFADCNLSALRAVFGIGRVHAQLVDFGFRAVRCADDSARISVTP